MISVVFVNSPRKGFYFGENIEPLGILYLSSYLKKKLEDYDNIHLINLDIKRIPDPSTVVRRILKHNPDIVGFNVFPTSEYYLSSIAKQLKEEDSRILTVFGGAHATACFKRILAHYPWIDIIVVGEGEETFLELCKYVAYKENESTSWELKDIRGICFRDRDGEIKCTPQRPLIQNLDKIPFPDRSLLPPNFYQKTKVAYVVTSRGCMFNCSFCLSPILWRGYRERSVNNVISELYWLHTELGIEHVFFWDDNFPVSKKRLSLFYNKLREYGVDMSFTCYSRSELLTKDITTLLGKCNFQKVRIGVETPQPLILQAFKKTSVLRTIKPAILNCQKANIKTHASFQIGFPSDTPKSINFTINYAISLNPNYAYFYFFIPYPGTPIYALYEKYLTTQNLEKFWLFNPVVRNKNLNKRLLLWWLYRSYEKFYGIKGVDIPPEYSSKNIDYRILTPSKVVKFVYHIQKQIYPTEEYIKW